MVAAPPASSGRVMGSAVALPLLPFHGTGTGLGALSAAVVFATVMAADLDAPGRAPPPSIRPIEYSHVDPLVHE